MKAWERQPGEPDLWYFRFETYRLMGPLRSIKHTYEIHLKLEAGLNSERPGTSWSVLSRQWHWIDRARAWDQEEREKFLGEEEDLRTDYRRGRLQMVGELMGKTFSALMTAEVDALDKDDARRFFPQLRLLLLALMSAQREEMGERFVAPSDDGSGRASSLEDEVLELLNKVYGEGVVIDDAVS